MFCVHCGKQIPDDSNVCMFCGKAVEKNNTNITEEIVKEEIIEEIKEELKEEIIEEIKEEIIEEVNESSESKEEKIEAAEIKNEESVKEAAESRDEAIVTETVESKDENATSEIVDKNEESKVSVAANVEKTVVSEPAKENVAVNNIPVDEPKKSGNGAVVAIIIILLIILLAVGGFLFYWFSRPIYKIDKAIAKEDIATVVELYGELNNDDDKKYVQDQMYNYAVGLEEKFISEEIEYDFIDEQFSLLGKKILKGDKDFEDLREDVDALNASREAFAAAEKAYKRGDYQTAYNNYILVIKGDDNYRDAQKKAEECKALLGPFGSWAYTLDIGPYLLDYIGLDGYDLVFNLDLCMDFNEDNTGCMYIDESNLSTSYDAMMDVVVEYYYDYFGDMLNYSRDEVDELIYDYYGCSLKEMLYEEISTEDISDSFGDTSVSFNFEIQDDTIIMTGDIEDTAVYSLDGDTLTITFDYMDMDLFYDFGVEMPIVFNAR